MAKAVTQKFAEMVLETSDDGSTWSRICGLNDVTITRTANVDEAEVPDCDDESLPLSVEKEVRSINVSVSAEGVWAQQSHGTMMDWFYSSATRQTRLGNLNAAVGETEYEQAPALLSTLTHTRTKGQKVTASIELMFDGTPERTPKA